MTRQVVELVRLMSREDWDEDLLVCMCQNAVERLKQKLRPGLTPEDCCGTFPVAAAWMALETLWCCGEDNVQSFSAGDLTVHTGGGDRTAALREQTRRLMAPYCRETEFAFRGVQG